MQNVNRCSLGASVRANADNTQRHTNGGCGGASREMKITRSLNATLVRTVRMRHNGSAHVNNVRMELKYRRVGVRERDFPKNERKEKKNLGQNRLLLHITRCCSSSATLTIVRRRRLAVALRLHMRHWTPSADNNDVQCILCRSDCK